MENVKQKVGSFVVKLCKETARAACGMASYWGPYQMKEPRKERED